MYHIQIHVPYTDTCTIYRYMYHIQIHVPYTDTCTIYRYMYHIQIHVPYTDTCTCKMDVSLFLGRTKDDRDPPLPTQSLKESKLTINNY